MAAVRFILFKILKSFEASRLTAWLLLASKVAVRYYDSPRQSKAFLRLNSGARNGASTASFHFKRVKGRAI